MATQSNLSTLHSTWIGILRQREDELGCRAPDGASADELEDVLCELENLTAERRSLTPAELNELMKKIEFVMDAWLFPEDDPVAPEVRKVLAKVHANLGNVLDVLCPKHKQIASITKIFDYCSGLCVELSPFKSARSRVLVAASA